ncbi:hypothetical protein GCM10017687_04740 [Streptomyces echinatus]|uniref:hypothetical protein n=1 Tax=Streptomyces echinatus TaxID=67293 RepID=UPI0031F0A62F
MRFQRQPVYGARRACGWSHTKVRGQARSPAPASVPEASTVARQPPFVGAVTSTVGPALTVIRSTVPAGGRRAGTQYGLPSSGSTRATWSTVTTCGAPWSSAPGSGAEGVGPAAVQHADGCRGDARGQREP